MEDEKNDRRWEVGKSLPFQRTTKLLVALNKSNYMRKISDQILN